MNFGVSWKFAPHLHSYLLRTDILLKAYPKILFYTYSEIFCRLHNVECLYDQVSQSKLAELRVCPPAIDRQSLRDLLRMTLRKVNDNGSTVDCFAGNSNWGHQSTTFEKNFAQTQHLARQLDRSDGNLQNFLSQNPDPTQWFCRQFPYINQQDVNARITPLGVIFHMEGAAYKSFVRNEGIQISPDAPFSIGVTLTLNSLPKHLHNLFVAVNLVGDAGWYRSDYDVACTENHEIIHQIFNRCWNFAPFVSNCDLENELSRIPFNDMKSHQELAARLGAGMIGISISEGIAYYGTGFMHTKLAHLNGNFWTQDHEILLDYLKGCSKQQRHEIMGCYKRAHREYRIEMRDFIRYANDCYNRRAGSDYVEYLVDLFLYKSSGYDLRRAAMSKLPKSNNQSLQHSYAEAA